MSALNPNSTTLNELVYGKVFTEVLETKTDFLNDIPDLSSKVITADLVDPMIVLANVTSMPETLVDYVGAIPDQDLEFDGTTVKLKRLDTQNTPITDKEAATTSMDVAKRVLTNHAISISEKHKALSVFNLAPLADSANTPVLPTTGTTTNTRGYKKFTESDLQAMYAKLMDTNTPEDGLVAVLATHHINELCESSQGVGGFNAIWNARKPGQPVYYSGFTIWGFPTQNVMHYKYDGTKNAFGSTMGNQDRRASIFFNKYECAKFSVPEVIYLAPSKMDPTGRASKIGVRKYALTLPINGRCIGAIYEG